MTEEWGPLIKHDGKGCPVTGMFCEVHSASKAVTCGIVMDNGGPCSLWVWAALCIICLPHRVVAYRVRKPRALLDLIDMVENLPAPTKIREDRRMTPARKAALQWFHDQKQVREAWKHPWEIPGSPTKKMINLMLDDRQLTWTHGQGHFLTDKGRRMLHGDAK